MLTVPPVFTCTAKSPGERRVGDAVLDAIDDPRVARSRGGRLEACVARLRPVIVDAQRGVAVGLVLGDGEIIAVVGEECRQEAAALLVRHRAVEKFVGECRGLRQHRGDVGIADRQFLGDDAAGEIVGAGAARVLRERKRAQAYLRGLVEHVQQQRPLARFEPGRRERWRRDLLRDEIADSVADFQLLGAEVKIVHSTCLRNDRAPVRGIS